MELEKIKLNLCQYDERNPNNTLGFLTEEYGCDEKNKKETIKNCACDNCFYRRTELANYILEIILKDKKLNKK